MATKWLTNEEIRNRYIPDRRAGFKLLEDYREGRLNKQQRQAVWLFASDLVCDRAKKHYKRSQAYGERKQGRVRNWYEAPKTEDGQEKFIKHSDRVAQLLTFICENPDQTIPALITAWRKRFSWFEMVRDLEASGIGCDGDTLTEKVNKSNIRYLITIKKLVREWKQLNKGRYPEVDDIAQMWASQHGAVSKDKLRNMSARIEGYFRMMRRINAVSWSELEEIELRKLE